VGIALQILKASFAGTAKTSGSWSSRWSRSSSGSGSSILVRARGSWIACLVPEGDDNEPTPPWKTKPS
jgi:hypothetical protein